jgi:hypothetical protein
MCKMAVDEVVVRLFLAGGALILLGGSVLQAWTELADYRYLVAAADLTDTARRELLTQYSRLSLTGSAQPARAAPDGGTPSACGRGRQMARVGRARAPGGSDA